MPESILSIDEMPIVVILVVVATLLGSLYVSFKFHPDQFPKTRVSVFFSALASVAIFLVGINVVMTSVSIENNQKFMRIQQTKSTVDKLWLYPNKLILESRHIRPQFLAGFYTSNAKLYELGNAKKDEAPQSIESIVEEQFISNVLIQAWEDYLEQRNFDDTELEEWLRAFLTWAQNPYFKSYYEMLSFEYRDGTNQFAQILFDHAKSIPVPTTDTTVYTKTVQRMLHDPRLISLLKNKEKEKVN
jgi:hypothetical protein